jgi:hypothetical protein
MAASAAAAATELYDIACRWADVTDDERQSLKDVVTRLVGYPCKVACEVREGEGRVELFVLSVRTDDIEDVLEIQASGAIGIVYDQYDDPDEKRVVKVDNRCDSYNDGMGLVFEEHSDSDDDSEEEEASVPKEKKD